MKGLEQSVRGHLRHNVLVNMLDASFYGLAWGFGATVTMLPLFVSRLTDSALLIGLISAIQGLAWHLPQLFMANRVSRLRCYRPLVMRLTLNERVPYLGLALVAFWLASMGRATALALTFALVLWQGLGSGLVANPWQNMVAKIIPCHQRGTFFGLQAALRNLLIGVGAVAAGFILDRMNDRADFALCFLLTAAIMGISMMFLGMTREPVDDQRVIPASQPSIWEGALEILRKDRNFAAYLLVRLLYNFATMGFAFYIVYGLRRFEMNEVTAGFLTAALAVTLTVANAAMGLLGDRFGHRAMLVAGSLAAMASGLLAWGAQSILWLYPVFILSGLARVAYETSGMAITVEFGTEETRPRYIGLANTLVAPATILAPLTGGWIADASGFETTFIVSAVGGVVIAILLFRRVRDPQPRGQRAVRRGDRATVPGERDPDPRAPYPLEAE